MTGFFLNKNILWLEKSKCKKFNFVQWISVGTDCQHEERVEDKDDSGQRKGS